MLVSKWVGRKERKSRVSSATHNLSAGEGDPLPHPPQHGCTPCAGSQAPPLLGPMSRKPFPQIKIYHYTPGHSPSPDPTPSTPIRRLDSRVFGARPATLNVDAPESQAQYNPIVRCQRPLFGFHSTKTYLDTGLVRVGHATLTFNTLCNTTD